MISTLVVLIEREQTRETKQKELYHCTYIRILSVYFGNQTVLVLIKL